MDRRKSGYFLELIKLETSMQQPAKHSLEVTCIFIYRFSILIPGYDLVCKEEQVYIVHV